MSWHTGKFRYTEARLATVFQDMEHYYNIEIETDNHKLLDCRFNGSFDNLSPEDALEIVSFSFNITVKKIDENVFNVSGKGCE